MSSEIAQKMNNTEIGDFFAGEAEMPTAYMSLALAVNWLFKTAKQLEINDLSPIKLQKILYFMHGRTLRETGRPLIKEHAQAWQYGPVFPTAYHEYKLFGANPISLGVLNYMVDIKNNNGKVDTTRYVPKISETELEKILLQTIMKYKDIDGIKLSELTHRNDENNPWIRARELSRETRIENFVMPHIRIKEYFANYDDL